MTKKNAERGVKEKDVTTKNNYKVPNIPHEHTIEQINSLFGINAHKNLWEPLRTYENLREPLKTTENLWEPLRTYRNL